MDENTGPWSDWLIFVSESEEVALLDICEPSMEQGAPEMFIF